MSKYSSHRLLLKAFKRGDFSYRGLSDALKNCGIKIDHKTIGSYVCGDTRPKTNTIEKISKVAFIKSNKERIEYLSLWKKEDRQKKDRSAKNKILESHVKKAKQKGVIADAGPAVSATWSGTGEGSIKSDGEIKLPDEILSGIGASVWVQKKAGEKILDIFQINHKGGITFYVLDEQNPATSYYYKVATDMHIIIMKLEEYAQILSVHPIALLEIAFREVNDSALFDATAFQDGSSVLISIEILQMAQRAMRKASDKLEIGQKDASIAEELHFYDQFFEGWQRSDLLPEMKERILETINMIKRRF
jgi:hypothetical protein